MDTPLKAARLGRLRDFNMGEHSWRSLSDIPVGRRILVRQLCGGKGFASRLAILGFNVGVEVQVFQNCGRGPLIALVRGTRVALGRGEAAKILVQEVSDDRGA